MKKTSNIINAVFGLLLFAFLLLPQLQAVVPAPDGGYPGGNTAEGDHALFSLNTGAFNTAIGWYAQWAVTDGSYNTAVGAGALDLNTGSLNTAIGTGALLSNAGSDGNTAAGALALFSNIDGNGNTAIGHSAMFSTAHGSFNTAVGELALNNNVNTLNSVAIGWYALGDTTGSHNIAIGTSSGSNLTNGDGNIDIGNVGVPGEFGTIRIGNSLDYGKIFIAGIHGVNEGGTAILPVYINSAGQLGTSGSSRRFKKEIKLMGKASEAILSLKPVTFEYKNDDNGTPEFGLIAEDVAAVNPDLVVRDKKGAIYTVRYDAVNAMLLNEFLKEHRTVQQQQKEIDALKTELQEQRTLIQKVTAQFAASNEGSRMRSDNDGSSRGVGMSGSEHNNPSLANLK